MPRALVYSYSILIICCLYIVKAGVVLGILLPLLGIAFQAPRVLAHRVFAPRVLAHRVLHTKCLHTE